MRGLGRLDVLTVAAEGEVNAQRDGGKILPATLSSQGGFRVDLELLLHRRGILPFTEGFIFSMRACNAARSCARR
jgi:hypothetical protein